MSRPSMAQLREEDRQRRCDPAWSQDQAEWVAGMQCNRPPELVEMHPPAPKVDFVRIVVSMECMVCGAVCAEDDSHTCGACRADERRDRGT